MRGGARPGAGRKAGARNKRTADMIDAAKAVGQLPHEFLAAIARGETIDGHEPSFEQRIDAAKHAAPYFAPRLSNIEANVAVTGHEAALSELE